jgi:hypothetical protein
MTTIIEETEPEVEVDTAEFLRERVEAREGPANKTIITFEYSYNPEAKKKEREWYTFVSIWIAKQGKWYNTGVGNGVPRECSNDALMNILASRHVKSAAVATVLDRFKP